MVGLCKYRGVLALVYGKYDPGLIYAYHVLYLTGNTESEIKLRLRHASGHTDIPLLGVPVLLLRYGARAADLCAQQPGQLFSGGDVIRAAYAAPNADYLLRRQGLSLKETASVIAAPFWSTIEGMDEKEAEEHAYLRKMYSSLLITGPFSIILGFEGGLMALNDRLKLRSMVTAEKDDKVYIASEEAAIRAMAPDAGEIYSPAGGEPIIIRVKEGAY